MTKPSFNASLEELAGQSNRGGMAGGPTSPNMGGAMRGSGGIRGAGAGTGANWGATPPRGGAANPVAGHYMNQPGSPPGSANQIKPGNVPASSLGGASKQILTHGRTLGAVAHLRSIGADHPHLAEHHAKATAGLAALKKAGNMSKKQGLSSGPKFGALGGSSSSGNVGMGVPGAGMAAPAAQPLGMTQVPDEM